MRLRNLSAQPLVQNKMTHGSKPFQWHGSREQISHILRVIIFKVLQAITLSYGWSFIPSLSVELFSANPVSHRKISNQPKYTLLFLISSTSTSNPSGMKNTKCHTFEKSAVFIVFCLLTIILRLGCSFALTHTRGCCYKSTSDLPCLLVYSMALLAILEFFLRVSYFRVGEGESHAVPQFFEMSESSHLK